MGSERAHGQASDLHIKPAAGQAGFSLIELLIALAVFGLGLVGIVTMQVSAAQGLQTARNISLATNLSSSKLEAFVVEDFELIANGEETYSRTGLLSVEDPFFTVSWQVEGIDLKELTVTSQWLELQRSGGSTKRSVVLRSKLTR